MISLSCATVLAQYGVDVGLLLLGTTCICIIVDDITVHWVAFGRNKRFPCFSGNENTLTVDGVATWRRWQWFDVFGG